MSRADAGGAPGSGDGRERQGEAARERTRHTRWLYARVLVVQVLTLIALYLLQTLYGGG
ncbi:MAG: hypothetical protein R3314_12015 [Longimicrobiales bacterium]|nr:hypothetical protein [Longimicrobiales bacterium]